MNQTDHNEYLENMLNIHNQQQQQQYHHQYHEQLQQSAAGPSTSTAALMRLDRKTTEKKRRMHMKSLCSRLISLVPNPYLTHSSGSSHKATLTQIDQLEEATNYIQQLKERVNHLKNKKQELITTWGLDHQPSVYQSKNGTILPVIELREVGSHCLELIFITTYEMMKTNDELRLSQAVNILEEEGADVVNANVSTVEDMVFHTLIAEIRIPRVGVNMSRVGERLHQLISHPAH